MYMFIKRGLDVCLSLILLVLLSPAFVIIAVVIRYDSCGKALFRQVRSGKNGKPFVIFKFRTMFIKSPQNVATVRLPTPHRYITPVGRFLRQTSLDELPQLFNVLKGDMSFVGPRPVILSEKSLLALRHRWGADKVRPGITGLAQIRGRDTLPPATKARYDAEYARNCSFWLDFYIIMSTIKCVLRREGIREGSADLYQKS